MRPYLLPYAGQQMATGAQNRGLCGPRHRCGSFGDALQRCYAMASAAELAHPNNTAIAGDVAIIFKGTTLCGQFWHMSQIAGDAALAAFILAGIMLVLVSLGQLHYRRVSVVTEL